MREFSFIALTPPGLIDPSIAIAAGRASELGVLDLEYADRKREQAALKAIERLARYTNHVCGIKLDGGEEEFIANITSNLPKQVRVVILTPTDPHVLRRQIKALRDKDLTVLLETICLDQALLGEELGVAGLIAKGHEAGGWVGQETAFILLQRLLNRVSLPVWAHGGIGLHTAAACFVAGAAGAVLDYQLALTRESSLPKPVKDTIVRMDGSETTDLGSELGMACRLYARPRLSALESLGELEKKLIQDSRPSLEILVEWRQEIRAQVGWGSPERHIWLLGQDAAFAASLAHSFRTVAGVLNGIRLAIDEHIKAARSLRPFNEGAPLARSHGTRYPIVQGPMTRVSDRPSFACEVAEMGGLPFLACGLLRGSELGGLLKETQKLLGNRPWGVGIIGFAPSELLGEQLELIRAYHPPFALIAGGLPEQALSLEREGIATYLHVASPELLRMFIENGARRFVFEGHECGGHVGPRSSFVLWNQMIDVLSESLSEDDPTNFSVLFAGGIHDAISSSMVAAAAGPLAGLGVRVGVLMGTAYLFTKEAVTTGALLKGFQQRAIKCIQTVVLETGQGHASRCAVTPYAEFFRKEKQRLLAKGKSPEEIRLLLEDLNLGRLGIASKGVRRNPKYGDNPQAPKYVSVRKERQCTQGMYMIGQLAALRDQTLTIEELHHEVSVEGSQRLTDIDETGLSHVPTQDTARPCDVAIIGMACLLPKAPNLHTYWENILNKVDAIIEVPEDRWDWRIYYDPDPKKRDKVSSKWGGFLDAVPFDPMRYGMPPNTMTSIEPLQLLTLETVRMALRDAGYAHRPFTRERTSVILGVGGGIGDLGQHYVFRSNIPMFFKDAPPEILDRLPEWTEDSFPGTLLNVTAGRVANRFDLGGVNYTVDAACASSLAALYLAVRELENGTSDMVIVGGGDTAQSAHAYLCFSKTNALSPTGRSRAFDESADGTVIGEGVAALVLKRLGDAEREGDRIYAVIKGVGTSSDGRDKGLTAPRPEGQKRALDRAYAQAGISPEKVELIEAHGTGTVAGDRAEIETLRRVFEAAGAAPKSCALGSVKSMIGHTKCTAGIAGLIKIALALYHKVLPPTIGITKPNSSLDDSPFYINTQTRPWVPQNNGQSRCAGASSFGFGGSNFHAVLEEYSGNFLEAAQDAVVRQWPSELIVFGGQSRQELLTAITSLDQALTDGARPTLPDLAFTLWQHVREDCGLKLAVVASSLNDLKKKLAWARVALDSSAGSEPLRIQDPRGIYFTEEPLPPGGRVAFLFPGQGSQYPGMLGDLAIHFREVRERFELADRVLSDRFPQPLSAKVFPPPSFVEEEEGAPMRALTQTNVAQPAIGAANLGLFHLLREFGVKPDMVAGHSYGEYVALCVAGIFSEEALYILSEARGRFILEATGQDLGTMAAVEASRETVVEALHSIKNVWVSNLNAPKQTIISGAHEGVAKAVEALKAKKLRTTTISVSCPFHSPLMAPVQERFGEFLSTIDLTSPELEVFSNTHAAPYPCEPKAIGSLLIEHFARPVEFIKEIEAMYRSGARVFIEVGPRSVLTSLTQQILGERIHLAVALDNPGRSGLTQMQHSLGQLLAYGVPFHIDRLFEGRGVRLLNLRDLAKETTGPSLGPTTWMVNGGRAWPLGKIAGTKLGVEPPNKERASLGGDHPREKGRLSQPRADGPGPSEWSRTAKDSPKGAEQGQSARPVDPTREAAVPGQHNRSDDVSGSTTADGEADDVILQHQRLMRRFLEVHHQVMMAYLSGNVTEGATLSADLPDLAKVSDGLAAPDMTPSASEPLTSRSMPSPEVFTSVEGVPDTKQELTGHLLQIVSERTGYPSEMLDLDLDLEADLGIDSIKRVEILGILQKRYLSLRHEQTQEAMEELTRLKTLRKIIDWCSDALSSRRKDEVGEAPPSEEYAEAGDLTVEKGEGETVELSRFLLTVDEAPLGDHPLKISPKSLFLITNDERGVAQSMADELKRLGGQVALVRMGERVDEDGEGAYTADLADQDAVLRLVEMVGQRQGRITGIIHLLALTPGKPIEEMSLTDWRDRLRLEVKTLFYLTKNIGQDIKHAAKSRAGWVVAATASGGDFAIDTDERKPFSPGDGGIAGLIKTLALEWPGVCCKVVDLDPEAPSASLAGQLLGEMANGDGEAEVGYKDSRRLVPRLTPAPLVQKGSGAVSMDSSWVVLVTGGARGITAEVALELAERYRPTLLLVGRSPLPRAEESTETAGLNSPQELKAALIEQMRRRGEQFSLAQIESQYRHVCREREIRNNLKKMEQAGAKVRYYSVDVCDEHAFGDLIDEVYRSYGRVDGVIHGAGMIEDKLVQDKPPESFDRVFDTKVDGAFILANKIRPERLRFIVFFSSVAGRFGNRGQGDYVAANEVLNKLGVYLDGRWPGRVVAINWGPWAKTGMVTEGVQKQFSQRGVQLIRPAAGRLMFVREVGLAPKGQVEVSIVEMRGKSNLRQDLSADSETLPLLTDVSLRVEKADGLELERTLDTEHDVFLKDHRLDGKPVFPMAMAVELMAEVVKYSWPEWKVTHIRSLQVFRGIVLNDRIRTIRIKARPKTVSSPRKDVLEVETEITELDRPDRPCYRAVVQLGKQLPTPQRYDHEILSDLGPFPMKAVEAYGRWLFHGPFFQGISRIDGINDHGISGLLVPSSPAQGLANGGNGRWLIDPVLLDSSLQLGILWERAVYDMTPLPSGFSSYCCFDSPPTSSPVQCYVHTKPSVGGHILVADVYYVDDSGRVIGILDQMESSCTKALNRLTESHKSPKGNG